MRFVLLAGFFLSINSHAFAQEATEAPAPTENAPAPTENAPAPTENAPADDESSNAPTEETVVLPSTVFEG